MLCTINQFSGGVTGTGDVLDTLNAYYTYPMPENLANYNYSSVRDYKADTTPAVDNQSNVSTDFNLLEIDNTNLIDITRPYLICRLEGKDLVVRSRMAKETNVATSDVGERIAIAKNLFVADGLNHTIRLIMRPEGVEVYRDYSHLGINALEKFTIAKWKDPTTSSDGLPYCAFEIPKSKIYTCDELPYPSRIFVANPTNDRQDQIGWWDMFIGLPINIDFYFKRISVFENYGIDSFNLADRIISAKNYTGEYWDFSFSDNDVTPDVSGVVDTTTFKIRCEFSKIEPNINDVNYDTLYSDNDVLTPILTGTVISENQINLTWNAIANAASYVVKRASNAAFTTDVTTIYSGGLLLYNNTGLIANTHYYYRIMAIGNSGYGDSGYGYFDTTTLPTTLGSTAALTATLQVNSNEINLSWTAVTNNSVYILQRALDNTFTTSLITIYASAANSFVDTGLVENTHYYYRVKATAPLFTDGPWATDDETTGEDILQINISGDNILINGSDKLML